jgi:hypothetical protein
MLASQGDIMAEHILHKKEVKKTPKKTVGEKRKEKKEKAKEKKEKASSSD